MLEKTLESPWTARRSNQSILKEINPESSLEGLMLKLKLQYFGHLMWRADDQKRPWCWASLKAGGEGDARGWDGWMASPTSWTWVWVSSGVWWWTGKPGVLQSMGSHRVGHNWATELNWKLMQHCKSVLKKPITFFKKAIKSKNFLWKNSILQSLWDAVGSRGASSPEHLHDQGGQNTSA